MTRLSWLFLPVTGMLVLALFSAGCASGSLWEEQAWRPSDAPDLALAVNSSTQDLLVQYNERIEDTKHSRRRAYWLFASTNIDGSVGTPVFVKPELRAGLTPIPVLEEPPATNVPPVRGYLAVTTPAEQGFDLYWDGGFLGRYYLPTYLESPRPTVWRVVATPFAALGDVSVVVLILAATAGATVGIMYLESKAH
jgi:hypothetical protein